MKAITDAQWKEYEEKGYLKLGRIQDARGHDALCQRINDIMLGKADVDYDRMLMQLDSGAADYGAAAPQTTGFKHATLNYRKIQELEFDPLYLAYMQLPVWRDVCARVYGAAKSIACFRAMFFNKPVGTETPLPWHQDRWNHLDRDPLLTVWLALDPATVANGCVEIIPGSHRLGVINPTHPSGFLTDEQVKQHAPPEKREYLELAAGEVALLHNWLLHSSGPNRSTQSRRAFSVCYMDAATRTTHPGQAAAKFSVIFGDGALSPDTLPKSRA